jgi:hypothetical protein
MKLPNGKEVSGWWLLVAVLALAAILSFLPHTPDLQYQAK